MATTAAAEVGRLGLGQLDISLKWAFSVCGRVELKFKVRARRIRALRVRWVSSSFARTRAQLHRLGNLIL